MRALGPIVAVVTWLCPVVISSASPAPAAKPVTVEVSESVIEITPRYQGELVKVRGTAPSDCGVVVKLTSERETVFCSKRGKVGPFWLAVGRVRFDNVPSMYKVDSTEAIDDILSAADQEQYELGRRGLEASMTVQSGADRDLLLDELILIRERERLFSFRDGAVARQGDVFRTSIFWPPDGPPGRYRVEAYAVHERRVVGSASASVDVRMVGVEAWVRDLARTHGILYGLFAVGLALMAGLAASFVFKLRPRRGHGTGAAP